MNKMFPNKMLWLISRLNEKTSLQIGSYNNICGLIFRSIYYHPCLYVYIVHTPEPSSYSKYGTDKLFVSFTSPKQDTSDEICTLQ